MKHTSMVLLGIMLFSFSCKKSHVDYKTLANHLCICSEELYKKNLNFEEYVRQKKQDKAMAFMDSIAIEEDKFQSCILDENKKLKFYDEKNYSKALTKAIRDRCSNKEATIMRVVNDTKLKN